ncbi:MAG: cobyrinate a,c-diamide synthase [Rhodospirillales bacterium]|nr:cobyrinate a,c-diamide synthase [Rhodospirillales bacterium]
MTNKIKANRGLVIAAPASGSGKTVVTLGLIRHLSATGRDVASAKAGPDYIDPVFHAAAGGRQCWNLDLWAMRPATLAATAAGLNADTVICEGVMGLFDGAFVKADETGGDGNDGSTAELSRRTGWPVVLVIDARAQAQSAAAVLKGFAEFRSDVPIAGVIFNRVGGERHAEILRRACAGSVPHVPVLGCLPRTDGLNLPERHLGLVQAVEHPDLEHFMETAAALVAEHMDMDRFLDLARPLRLEGAGDSSPPIPPPGQRIAIARDEAFAFSYASVIEGWRTAGCEILPFSPLADEAPDADSDAVYLPGGYPELHAGRLAAASNFLAGLRARAASGAAVFGECGGYMVLGRGLVDADGVRHAMAGLLGLETSFAERKLHLGYRRLTALADMPLSDAGVVFRGHEFHYSVVMFEEGRGLFQASDAGGGDLGSAGLIDGRVAGSFLHLIDRE